VAKDVQDGRFREDLYYRLNVVQIYMLPLRERKSDIPLICSHFLKIFKEEMGLPQLKISQAAMDRMRDYDWPGNVRELRNAIERAVVMGNGQEVLPEDLPIRSLKKNYPGLEAGLSLREAEDRFKKQFIVTTLRHTSGNRSKAAKIMGIQRTYLSRLISKYELQGA
jgi:Nif-specific regulatory protein